MICPDELRKGGAVSAPAQGHDGSDAKLAAVAVAANATSSDFRQQTHETSPNLLGDLEPIDDEFLDRIRRLASLI